MDLLQFYIPPDNAQYDCQFSYYPSRWYCGCGGGWELCLWWDNANSNDVFELWTGTTAPIR